MSLIDVLDLADLEESKPTVVKVGGRDLVFVRKDQEVFALRNVCPHETQSFHGGQVTFKVKKGEGCPGVVAVSSDDLVLQCPWHQWSFDVRTGVCATDDKFRIRSYETVVRDGRVFVDMSRRSASREQALPE